VEQKTTLIMADPLTQVADEFAPAPLNVFDQKLADTVISRHANAKRGLATSDVLAQTAGRAMEMERAKQREMRDQLLQRQDEIEFKERQDADAMRGDLIADMYENLRPTEEGYDERLTGFLSTAPPSVVKDPVFNEVLRGLTRRADTAEAERAQNREIETRQKNTLDAIREREKYDDTMKFLTEEDLKTLPVDENGEPRLDSAAAGILAAQRKREAGVEDFAKKTDIRLNAAKEILNEKKMDSDQKELFRETRDILINDREAFPTQVDSVLALAVGKKKKADIGLLAGDSEFGPLVRKAQEWDKKQFENEVLTAKKYPDPEKYVGLVTGLSPAAAESRRRVWEYAHQNDGTAPAAPAQAAPTPPAPAPTAPAPASTQAAPAPTRTVVAEVQHPDGYLLRKYSDGKIVKVMPKK
jgi:hypothetical protein